MSKGQSLHSNLVWIMKRATARVDILPLLPVVFGLGETEAAAAIGISASKFRILVKEARMPRPRNQLSHFPMVNPALRGCRDKPYRLWCTASICSADFPFNKAPDYGGQEFEFLRARHLVFSPHRQKRTALDRLAQRASCCRKIDSRAVRFAFRRPEIASAYLLSCRLFVIHPPKTHGMISFHYCLHNHFFSMLR